MAGKTFHAGGTSAGQAEGVTESAGISRAVLVLAISANTGTTLQHSTMTGSTAGAGRG